MDEHRIQLITMVITRIPITLNQLCLFKALYEAGDYWVSKSELAYRMQECEPRLDKILGGLGKRIKETQGTDRPYDGYGLLMAWDTYHDELHYRGLPEFRTVIERFPILLNVLNLSVDEIRQLHRDGLAIT